MIVCTRCGASRDPQGKYLRKCTHPAGHVDRDLSTRLGAKAKPLPKATPKGDRDAAYFQHIVTAKQHMQRAIHELQQARQIHYEWDLELTGRQIGTLIYFLEHGAKL